MAGRLPLSPHFALKTIHDQPWTSRAHSVATPAPARLRKLVVRGGGELELEQAISSALAHHLHQNPSSVFVMAESVGYSLASYYTSLGLFVISVPGLWSLIKRSVKSKIVQKTYIKEGEAREAPPNQVAGEILSFFTRNNFVVLDRGETIT